MDIFQAIYFHERKNWTMQNNVQHIYMTFSRIFIFANEVLMKIININWFTEYKLKHSALNHMYHVIVDILSFPESRWVNLTG